MPARSVLPDVPTLLRELDTIDPDTGKPITRTKLAQKYKVTPQAISVKLRGVVEQQYRRRDWPWDVQSQHKTKWFYRALTLYQITLKKERVLTTEERGTLVRFMEQVDTLNKRTGNDLVVDYDPSSAAGFFLRPRREGDDHESLMGTPAE